MSPSALLVVDPRPPATSPHAQLSRRPADLDGQTVLLLDNGKLRPEFGHYRAIFDVLLAELKRRFPTAHVQELQDDLLVGGADRLTDLATELAAERPAAVILALCDTGVSQPSVMLAAELESRGIPTSLVAQGVGLRLAASTAASVLPGLPLSAVTGSRIATYDEIRLEAEAIAPDVFAGLVEPEQQLKERFAAHGVTGPATAVPGGMLEVSGDDPTLALTQAMAECGLGDGFPLVATTPERVERVLDAMGVPADEQVWPAVPPRATPVTAREIAVIAAMAGCQPQWAPIVLAAYQAMAAPEFRLFQAAITTHPSGTLVLVSGPAAERVGLASGSGCLGPGFPANAAIGRAVALSYSFLFGVRPGAGDLTAQGSPAEYAYCCAESVADSPWPGLHVDLAGTDTTTVTVLKCEGPHNVLNNLSVTPETLLQSFASTIATLGGNNAYNASAQTVVFLNPEHAAILAHAGWTKQDVQAFLFEAARHDPAQLQGRGIAPIWPAWFDAATRTPVVERPEDFLIVVVGGTAPQSQVAIPWGYSRGVTRTLNL